MRPFLFLFFYALFPSYHPHFFIRCSNLIFSLFGCACCRRSPQVSSSLSAPVLFSWGAFPEHRVGGRAGRGVQGEAGSQQAILLSPSTLELRLQVCGVPCLFCRCEGPKFWSEKGIGSLGIGVMDGHEPPCGN